MLQITETAYPMLADSFEKKELAELFSPSREELDFVNQDREELNSRLPLLTMLKTFQHLGYFPKWNEVPKEIPQFLATSLGYLFSWENLSSYDGSTIRARHMWHIRSFLQIKSVGKTTFSSMRATALLTAESKEHLADIVNVMLEELIYQRYELPAFSRFIRIAQSARAQVNEACYGKINDQLSPLQKKELDQWLEKKTEAGGSWWTKLKYEPPSPSSQSIREYLSHIRWLKQYTQKYKVRIDIPDAKRQQFAYEAYACDLQHIKQLKPAKRYTFLLILMEKQMGKALDNLILMFIRRMRRMNTDAKEALKDYHEKSREQVGLLLEQLFQIGEAYQSKGSYAERFQAIEAVMPHQPELMLEKCQTHLAYLQSNHLLCLLPLYKSKRSLLFKSLAELNLQASSQDTSLLDALAFILGKRNSRKQSILLDQDLELSWVGERWRRLIHGKTTAIKAGTHIHRKYFELCVFFELSRQLESGDVFVPGTEFYDDYTRHLISWEAYNQEIEEFEAISAIPVSEKAFIEKVQSELLQAADRTNQAFPHNRFVRIEKGKLILSKLQKQETEQDYPLIDQELKSRMAPIGILQLLKHTEAWLGLHKHFHHLSGNKSRIKDYPERWVSTLFCYGSLMGPSQAARSIKGISRKQISWIHDHHISEERLNKAINKVINTYKKFQLPSHWGKGDSASADGTHWTTYQKNLFSQYHLRYGAYGGVGYYHVSDTYIALFSHFIPCGVYEAVYILDGLIKNESDIQAHMLHGDTHAQSTVVFGLAYMLGIKLMPRIRRIKDLTFFRPDKTTEFSHIQELFSESINWELIEKHLPDMLRVILSIKKGKITPSTILRRLGSHSRKNKLYFAFRELGRAVRTTFLLDYIQDVEIRKLIFAATNKSEEFNQFVDWVAFANKVIPENLRHEQSKIIKYNHLMANMIMLYNVDQMTKVFNQLAKEGYPITPKILKAFAPYRNEHINRFGSYDSKLKWKVKPLQHELIIPQK
ncbi:MAG: Tn3 family transposase [Bacteroidota bacterium]